MNVKIIVFYWICIYFCYGLDAAVPNDESEEIPPPSVVTDSPVDFIVDGPETIQLPSEKVIFRVVFGENEIKKDMGNWSFYWVPIEGLGNSYADAYDEPILTLTKLKPGKLKFQVTVSNQIVSGHHEKSLIVYEPKKDNIKPIAMIKPPGPVKISENSQLVLDGEGSKDDDGKITTFEWHLKKGPSVQLPNDLNTPILTLNHLQPGNYTFLLKVTDNSNESNETEIDVIVTEERDDPPKARISRCGDTATGSITVRLPITALYLCGNGSTDDVGVVDYKWTRKDSLLPVDSTGSSTSILTLTNIHSNEDVGPYMFELQVGDAKGQKDTATISIFVNKAENQPPKVSAGTNVTITLPETSAVLDGTVEDDGTIVTYKWKQIDGPTQSKLVNDDKSKATAMDLHEGIYGFEFVVVDDGGLNATSKVFITVERVKNDAPKAIAANITIKLPKSIVSLSALNSTDDAGIVEYKWTPFDNVPACISALNESDSKPILLLSGLVSGEFHFNLTVYDQQRESDSTTVKLTIIDGEERLNSVEIYLEQKIEDITYRLRRKLENRLSAALATQIPEVSIVYVHFTDFGQDPKTGNLRVVFHAEYLKEAPSEDRKTRTISTGILPVLNAQKVVSILEKECVMIEEFSIIQIDALFCQRQCSGHGRCNNFTKECECETYWMGNLLTMLTSGKQLDCSWSKLYVFIIITSLLSIGIIFTGCSITMRRKLLKVLLPCCNSAKESFKRRRFRKKKKYEPLNQDGTTMVQMSSSSMISDSDESLFDSKTIRERNRK